MKNIKFGLTLLMSSLALLGCQSNEVAQVPVNKNVMANSVQSDNNRAVLSEVKSLKVATWNIEHLAYPATQGCKPRDSAEIIKLKSYAANLSADIVALQEVASYQAIESVFPANSWQIFISEREDSETYECRKTGFMSTQQKVAFAVRKGLDVKQVNSLAELALDNPGLRHGLELSVNTDFGPVTLLNVHMKSGCFVDNYSRATDRKSCATLAKQAPVLDSWIETREKQGEPYVVLGDFNHRLSAPYNHLTRLLKNNSDQSASSLDVTTKDLIGCHPYYPAPIDHILVGHMNNLNMRKQVNAHYFDKMEPNEMLSDHCAVSLEITADALPLSNAVKWQTTSAEYKYLTQSTYQNAANVVAEANFTSPWVVVMDIDETVLDNSGYQVGIDKQGLTYQTDTWNDWVESKQAHLVPGAKSFMETVIKHGGKLALITNRNRELDKYTWQNMLELGLPVSVENTCLVGRVPQDKMAIDGEVIKNDKDLRRNQLQQGDISCYQPSSERHANFPKLNIVMQIGDNIEDFSGVTQEHVDTVELLKNNVNELFLLPNPMYGSW